MAYFVRKYKRTDKWAIGYFGPEGHVYLDPRFNTREEAELHVTTVLGGKVI